MLLPLQTKKVMGKLFLFSFLQKKSIFAKQFFLLCWEFSSQQVVGVFCSLAHSCLHKPKIAQQNMVPHSYTQESVIFFNLFILIYLFYRLNVFEAF